MVQSTHRVNNEKNMTSTRCNKVEEAPTFRGGMSKEALSKRLGFLLRDNSRRQKMKLQCNLEKSSREKKS